MHWCFKGLVLGATLAVLAFSTPAQAREPHIYGYRMDPWNYLLVVHEDEWATIKLRTRVRELIPVGGDFAYEPTDEELQRLFEIPTLARVRAEVIKPAAPNFLGNPGQLYRIHIEGTVRGETLRTMFHANAGEVRERVRQEIERLYTRHERLESEALYYGVILALRALSQVDRLPADLSPSLLLSNVGASAIDIETGEAAERAGPVDRFGSPEEGRSFATELRDEPGLADAGRGRAVKGGDAARGPVGVSSGADSEGPARGAHDVAPRLGTLVEADEDTLGSFGEEPSAVEILAGTLKSPLQSKAEGVDR